MPAQLTVDFQADKDQYVVHENVDYTLSITNRAGKTITLKGEKRLNWLDINVKNQGGELLPYKRDKPTFKAVVIAAGQTVEKKIRLSDYYDLTKFGRYQAIAYVKLPDQNQSAMSSNNTQFLVTSGRTLFSQKIGLPNTANARKCEVINFNGSEDTELYVRITNEYTGQVIACAALSKYVTFREPKAALDRQNNLHLLYLITPTLYTHVVVTPTGKIAKRNYHRQGAVGEPRLESFANGEVKVAGTIPHDPRKARQEKEQERKASDRPKLIY